MIKIFFYLLPLCMLGSTSCNGPEPAKKVAGQSNDFNEGEFGYDLRFLQKHDDVIVLKDGESAVIVSPKYQAKVFTSTASGEKGPSFGWVNYKAFIGKPDAHMNAYGGENRLWLGPEGGRFSLFFKPGAKMVFDNWKTPSPIDTESWTVTGRDSNQVSLRKEMNLENYAGTQLTVTLERKIAILAEEELVKFSGVSAGESVKMVGYQTDNILTNRGKQPWTEKTGMPCIWMLDMFKPSPSTVIIVPFEKTDTSEFNKVATTNYFGEIPADRLKHNDSLLFFKADGNSRGKLGIAPNKAKHRAGSYDARNRILTVLSFDLDPQAKYLNQEWNTSKPSFSGDAVNSYNDGPLTNGSQMGPFYEIESVSPAAFLKPGESLSHVHAVYHFTGEEKVLDGIARRLLGISLAEINNAFPNEDTK